MDRGWPRFGFLGGTSWCRPTEAGTCCRLELFAFVLASLGPYSAQISGLADGLSYLHTIPIVHSDIRGVRAQVFSMCFIYLLD